VIAPTRHRRPRSLAIAIAVTVLAAGCASGAASQTATTTTVLMAPGAESLPDPAAWLLPVSDLPEGWMPRSQPRVNPCNGASFAELAARHRGRSSQAYFEHESVVFGDLRFAFPNSRWAAAFVRAVRSQVRSCESWYWPAEDGRVGVFSQDELSPPTLGDQTYGFRMTLHLGEAEAASDLVFARRGRNVVGVTVGGLGGGVGEVDQYARRALAALPGRG
jgi:hypothetical protein